DRDDVRGRVRLEQREEGEQAPDGTEVVRPRHALDLLRPDLEEAAAARDAGVVHEQVDCRMPLANTGGDALDVLAVGHVARLGLRAELLGDALQALLAPGEKDEPPIALAEPAGNRLSDPARSSRDDGDADSGRLVRVSSDRFEDGLCPLARPRSRLV